MFRLARPRAPTRPCPREHTFASKLGQGINHKASEMSPRPDVHKARQMLRLLIDKGNILPVALGTAETHLEAEIVGSVTGLIQVMRPQ